MSSYQTRSRAAPDGKLHLSVPEELRNRDLRITMEPVEPASSPPGTRPGHREMTEGEWKAFIDSTAGSMPDFPDIERPGPADYDQRDFDW